MLNFNLLDDNESDNEDLLQVEEFSTQDIAIIGLSAQLPLVANMEEFWQFICNGVDFISEFPQSRRRDVDIFANHRFGDNGGPDYFEGAYLDEIDQFDYSFFRLSPKEASLMSPNQRLFLQTAWKSIEDAGYSSKSIAGSRTGVFIGFNGDSLYDYKRMILDTDPELMSLGVPGNINSIIAGRISYLLDLRGPSLCVDTACSSSLVAVHLACQSIRNQECEMAIAGSVKINLLPLANEVQIGIESSTWRARSFDDSADGTGAGEGVISFVLKPLHKAQLDGDAIHAVIKGSAVNQDGSSVGMTAPNVLAQEDVIVRAWNNAGIDPETISYFEAHGTGTKLGDPIEIAGIERAFRKFTSRKQFVALGSTKANIGHLDHAAGAMGLLKSILALKHQQIPPLMHFTKPNRSIDFIDSPVYVNNRLTDWAKGSSPRRCGVSAFGMSGTNCHLVVEEAPARLSELNESVEHTIQVQQRILTLSAKSEDALKQLVELYVNMDWDHVRLDDVCYVANTGRDHHGHRLAIIFERRDELVKKLESLLSHGWQTAEAEGVYCGIHKSNGLEDHVDIYDVDIQMIAQLYVQGAQIEWGRLYSNGSYSRVHLPTYPFARTRCWLDVEHVDSAHFVQATNDKSKFVSSHKVELTGRDNGVYSANERLVAHMWGTTLGFTQLKIEDNFFELGGDSILALKIVNSLSSQSSTHLQVSDLFNYATIEQLSKYMDSQSAAHGAAHGQHAIWNTLVPIEGREHYPLTSSQLRVFVQEQLGAGDTHNNTPFCIMVEGYIDQDRFSEAFRHLVNRHESLRTSFHYRDGEATQYVAPQVDFHVEYSKSSLDRLDSVIRQFIRPFDLANPPLIRVGLITVQQNKHLIIIDLHHIISDGVSSSILIKEFCELYKGHDLPEIQIQYKDYAVWHTSMLSSGAFQSRKQYWLEQLSGEVPLLQLPTDYPRAEKKSYQGNTLRVPMNAQLKQQLERLAKSQGVTMNTLLFSLYTLMLHEYSNQEQLVVGTLVAGRNHHDLEHVLGMFINFLPIRIHVDRELKFSDFMSKVSTTIVDAYEHDYPFDQIIQDLHVKTHRSRNPLYDTMFIYHNEYNMNPTNELQMDEVGLSFMEYPLPNTASSLDMKLDVWNDITGQLVLVLQYDTALFTQHSMNEWIDGFIKLANYVVVNPETSLSQIDVITRSEKHKHIDEQNLLPHSGDYADNINTSLTLAISSTFTAEPISDYISWWCEQFNVPVDIEHAAYHQVFQELLNPRSLLACNDGVNVLLIRFEDWIRDDLSADQLTIQKLDGIYVDLVKAFGERSKLTPYVVCIFPTVNKSTLSHEVTTYIEALNERWRSFLRVQEHVFIIECNYAMAALYQVAQVYDPVKDREGHLPFTDEFYSVIGTEIARKLVAWSRQDFKVIVLDCDHTLWSGVCGEDGPLHVEISEPYRELQQFMLERYNEGMLLAICSKNNEADVWEVFDNHPHMILTKEHFVASSINWNAKSSNIQQLAQQLNVGLDSFIFVDDSPMECSEMMLHCPSVFTIRLPEQSQQIPAFLQHAWAFDRLSVTEEDRKRTALYVAESKRQYHLDNEHTNMEDFLRSLNLRVRMTELTAEQLPRAAQLTQRTNQFNMSTIRRSEAELYELLAMPQTHCWGVEVDDRFGEYGFVGVVIAREHEHALVIDTFLLSCRVLGRQVEHTILSELSKHAKRMRLSKIEALFVSTVKNAPFQNFLVEAGWEYKSELDGVKLFSLHVDHIPVQSDYISVIVDNDQVGPPLLDQTKPVYNTIRRSAQGEAASSSELIVMDWDWDVLGLQMDSLRHRYHLLPLHHHNANRLLKITKHNHSNPNRKVGYDEAHNDTERELIAIWENLLDMQPIGVDDHFFDIGGSSLQAVSLASRIHQHYKVQFSLRELLVAPTIRLLAKLINRTDESVYTSIEPVPDQSYYPVTSAQKRLLVLNELDGESSAYNQPFMFRADGPLDTLKLEAACITLIHRHEALRTAFNWEQGQFVQRVRARVDFSIEYIELSTAALADRIKAFIRPFNIAEAPLFRAGVIKLEEQRHLLLFDMHHAISDGVSISILVRELLELYEGSSLPDLRIQYRDYAVWQHNLMQSDYMGEQEQYWLDVFADGEPVLNFPLDMPRPAIRSFEGNRISMELDSNVSDAAEKLASMTGTTPYMVFLAAYNIVLSKYSGQDDIVVGSPVAGRRHADLDPLIGMFVQTLALRNKPHGDQTFRQFIASVKEHTLLALDHQDYPFEQLINKLNVKRDLSRNPLFDTMFVYQNMTWAKANVTDMNVQMYSYDSGRSRFDLTLELAQYESGMRLNLEYATQLFHKRTMESLARHYLNIIKVVTLTPDVLISDIDMLDESERAKLLFGFNATQVDNNSSQSIQQMFEEQVRLRASDIAIVYGDERLTYMQLNHRANRLADELRALGVKPNQIVGIHVERSLEMVVSVLGVLKSGAAYLPIDPQYPSERIQYMLEDSLCEVLITHSSLSDGLPTHIECLFVDDERFAHEQQLNPRAVNTPNDLAYIIYTSGSTGKPKGVMIEHKGMINLQVYFQEKLGVKHTDKIVQFASFSFDASVWEMFMGLFNGAELHLLSQDVTSNYDSFAQYMNDHEITIATLPPTYLAGLHPDRLNTLSKVITAGSASTLELLKKWGTKVQYMNAYGPTESTICASVWQAPKTGMSDSMSAVPIGIPIPNTQLFVVNSYDQLQPIGVPGELCIGGAGIARGYLHRPQLTAQKFIANPFIPGMRMYRSGDLVRWLPDGNIEYLGRIDDQVKIRGYRIELGEVESCILKHPLVEQCVVVARASTGVDGQSNLYAYFESSNQQLEVNELRSFVSRQLPEYMVPTYLIKMAQLPLTANGKVDMKALPDPEPIHSENYVAPNNEIESRLTDIWIEILGVQTIGISDHFFELGGHSLKAIAMITRIHQELQVALTLKQVFRSPTIEQLAMEIKQAAPITYTSIPVAQLSESYPLSTGQKKLYVVQQLDGVDTAYNISGAYWVEGHIDSLRLEQACNALIRRHESLRTSFDVEDGEFVQYIHEHVQLSIQHIETNDEHLDEAVKGVIARFDLSKPPLMRVALVKSNDRHVLVFDMHHIISDGISTSIMIHDLLKLYAGVELPELPIQYKDYAVWQQSPEANALTERRVQYWMNALSGRLPNLDIPTDFPRPTIQSYSGSRVQITIDEQLTERLKALAVASNSTLYMVMLSGYMILLSKYSGQEDILVGTPSAGRTHADLHNVMGMFVNTLVIRNQPAGQLMFSQLLEAVKSNTIQAFDHQDYPFDLLVEKLQRARDVSRNPLFDAMFIMNNFDTVEIIAEHLTVKLYPFITNIAKFDLSLELTEGHKELNVSLDYANKLFREETANRMLSDYMKILNVITMNASVKLQDIQLLDKIVKRSQLLSKEIEFNF